MLALGVPSGPIPAVMLAALMVHGVSPGPLLIQQSPALFWGFIASMYVGNLMLLVLNLPLVGLFVNVLRVPYGFLYPAIIVFCVLGVYAVNGSMVDVWIAVDHGRARLDPPQAASSRPRPSCSAPSWRRMLEMSLRQSLAMSDGHYAIFVTRPHRGRPARGRRAAAAPGPARLDRARARLARAPRARRRRETNA